MSNSLVRTSLALFGYEDDLNDKKKRRKKKSKGALDLIPLNHRVIAKVNKKGKINLSSSKKLSVQEAKKQLKERVDPTEENVRTLLLLSGKKIDSELSDKLVKRALKRSGKAEETEKPVEEKTAFTEEDFAKFEAEYCEL